MPQKSQWFLQVLQVEYSHHNSYCHHLRVCICLLSNMTSYLADIRSQLYFDFAAWQDIYECFDYYAAR